MQSNILTWGLGDMVETRKEAQGMSQSSFSSNYPYTFWIIAFIYCHTPILPALCLCLRVRGPVVAAGHLDTGHSPSCSSGGFTLTIDHNPPHAPDKAGVTIEAPADAVVCSGPDLNNIVVQHPHLGKGKTNR